MAVQGQGQTGLYDVVSDAASTISSGATTLARSMSERTAVDAVSDRMDITEFLYQVKRSSEEIARLERQLEKVDKLHAVVIGCSTEEFLFLAVRDPTLTDLANAIDELCDRLPNLAGILRTLASKTNVLQPKPGGFLITNDELRDAKTRLQELVRAFETQLRRRISSQAAAEARSKESTRVRMAIRIRRAVADRQGVQAGDRYILQMLREADSLQATTSEDGEHYRTRWRLENPYSSIMRALETQHLAFIDSVLNTSVSGASLGRVASLRSALPNPIAYLFGSYGKEGVPSDQSGPSFSSLPLAPRTHDYIDEDEDAASLDELKDMPEMTHDWAEDPGSGSQEVPRKRWLVALVAIAIALVVGAAIALGVIGPPMLSSSYDAMHTTSARPSHSVPSAAFPLFERPVRAPGASAAPLASLWEAPSASGGASAPLSPRASTSSTGTPSPSKHRQKHSSASASSVSSSGGESVASTSSWDGGATQPPTRRLLDDLLASAGRTRASVASTSASRQASDSPFAPATFDFGANLAAHTAASSSSTTPHSSNAGSPSRRRHGHGSFDASSISRDDDGALGFEIFRDDPATWENSDDEMLISQATRIDGTPSSVGSERDENTRPQWPTPSSRHRRSNSLLSISHVPEEPASIAHFESLMDKDEADDPPSPTPRSTRSRSRSVTPIVEDEEEDADRTVIRASWYDDSHAGRFAEGESEMPSLASFVSDMSVSSNPSTSGASSSSLLPGFSLDVSSPGGGRKRTSAGGRRSSGKKRRMSP